MRYFVFVIMVFVLFLSLGLCRNAGVGSLPCCLAKETEEDEDFDFLEEDEVTIADPLEPLNRFFFQVNDKLYFWLLKPVATGYSKVVPEMMRISVRNAYDNAGTPIRFVNCLLQGKFKSAGDELTRFTINTTVGVLGLYDYAAKKMDLSAQDEDLGQTLGLWGFGQGFYINWPVLGPSSLRDSIGMAGDYYLDPVSYINDEWDAFAVKAGDRVNRASLMLGEYEDLKKDSLDPYETFKNIYCQYRQGRVDR